jgi:hypothetical protein
VSILDIPPAISGQRRVVQWSELSPAARAEGVSCAWIGSDGRYWPLTGTQAGTEGAFITGPIDGMVHVPFEGVWTTPAYGPPRFERTVDGRREISFTLGLMSSSSLGWYDTESRFWAGCRKDATGWFSVTTRRHGQLWIPCQLLEAPKCALPDDPAYAKVALHEIILAADGEPRWHRPDGGRAKPRHDPHRQPLDRAGLAGVLCQRAGQGVAPRWAQRVYLGGAQPARRLAAH